MPSSWKELSETQSTAVAMSHCQLWGSDSSEMLWFNQQSESTPQDPQPGSDENPHRAFLCGEQSASCHFSAYFANYASAVSEKLHGKQQNIISQENMGVVFMWKNLKCYKIKLLATTIHERTKLTQKNLNVKECWALQYTTYYKSNEHAENNILIVKTVSMQLYERTLFIHV